MGFSTAISPGSTEHLLRVDEYADHLGVSTNSVRRYIKAGRIPAFRIGPRLLMIDAIAADAALLQRAEPGVSG